MINTENKKEYLKRLSDDKGIISAFSVFLSSIVEFGMATKI